MSTYECHVTIEPVLDEVQLDQLRAIAKQHRFRVAELLMVKRPNDTPERSKYDTFMTMNTDSRDDVFKYCKALVEHLKTTNFKVWRYKIEQTLVDTRDSDKLGVRDYFNLLVEPTTR